MSVVTNVVVHLDYAPNAAEEALQYAGLRPLDVMVEAGGEKAFEDDIYAAAFNYLDLDSLVEWFVGLPWGEEGSALLSTCTEGESHEVVIIRGGKSQ